MPKGAWETVGVTEADLVSGKNRFLQRNLLSFRMKLLDLKSTKSLAPPIKCMRL